MKWSAKHWAFLESLTRYLALEGALRSAKSWALVRKIYRLCVKYPGIQILLSRFTQDALDAQLKALFYQLAPKGLLGEWYPEEEYRVVGPGSRVYLRALKSSQEETRYAKFSGLTLGAFGIDQAEEMPDDFNEVLKARCSQIGTPMQRIYVANPPDEYHWLAKEFPDDLKKMPPEHELIRVSIYDNAHNLPPDYIPDLERQYPIGHPLRRRFIDGLRGISYLGEPIYGRLFNRGMHLREIDSSPELPLYEAWDFGRAAVLWAQFPLGGRHYLGEYLGEPGEYLETFVPKALDLRARLFKGLEVQSCCDPAGADRTSHGSSHNAVTILKSHGVEAQWLPGSNQSEQRSYAIQQIASHLSRLTEYGPAVAVHPRCIMLARAFEAGYVKDDHAPGLTQSPSIIRPKKDGTYDHLMNDAEYLELNFGPVPVDTKTRRKKAKPYVPESTTSGY